MIRKKMKYSISDRLLNLTPRERRKRDIKYSAGGISDWFDEAVEPRINELKAEIDAIKSKIHELQLKINEQAELYAEYEPHEKPREYYELSGDQGSMWAEIYFLEEKMMSIEEMKLVCLFKNFEIALKELITTSFQDIKTDELFRWENVKSILKAHGIPIGNIRNHNLIDQLRLVNNNIKHSEIIGDKVKNAGIGEFERKDRFEYDTLSRFYERLKGEPGRFLKALSEKIIDYLFVFDDNRIEKIAGEYEERMDKEVALKLADSLIKRFTG